MSMSDIRWGQQIVVAEPGVGQSVTVGLLSVTSEMVGAQSVVHGVPHVRDWTVYIDVEADDLVRIVAPVVNVELTFSTGASAFVRRLRVPMVGAVVHVACAQLSVSARILSSGLLPRGSVQVSAYATPGRPSRGRVMQAYSAFSYVNETIPIPPFTTAVLAFASEAGATDVLPFAWRYNAFSRGVVTTPLVSDVGQWNTARAVPQDATGIVMLPLPNALFLNLGFEVDG